MILSYGRSNAIIANRVYHTDADNMPVITSPVSLKQVSLTVNKKKTQKNNNTKTKKEKALKPFLFGSA